MCELDKCLSFPLSQPVLPHTFGKSRPSLRREPRSGSGEKGIFLQPRWKVEVLCSYWSVPRWSNFPFLIQFARSRLVEPLRLWRKGNFTSWSWFFHPPRPGQVVPHTAYTHPVRCGENLGKIKQLAPLQLGWSRLLVVELNKHGKSVFSFMIVLFSSKRFTQCWL